MEITKEITNLKSARRYLLSSPHHPQQSERDAAAGKDAPVLNAPPSMDSAEYFGMGEAQDIVTYMPSTLDDKKRTVDAVWYGGATVPRMDPDTGEPYMLRLDMAGCDMGRLNAGAPVFDSHMRGLSSYSPQPGSKAARGVVLKAWPDGQKGMATLQFRPEGEDPDTDQMFADIKSGVLRNLSFGTWIYERKPDGPTAAGGSTNQFVATHWEPFEISPIPIAADYTTQFLSAQPGPIQKPAADNQTQGSTTNQTGNQPKGAQMPDPLQVDAGAGARQDEQALAAAKAQGIKDEQARAAGVEALLPTAKKHGLAEKFCAELKAKNLSVADARNEIFAALESAGQQDLNGNPTPIRGEGARVTRDGNETQFAMMQTAILLRADLNFYRKRKVDSVGQETSEFLPGCGQKEHQAAEEMAREYRGFSLLDMARESIRMTGRNDRGLNRNQVAQLALQQPMRSELFSGGSESTADFPSILANVANKTLRQAYEAYPQTFKPFSRQVTAADFKPINRVQLSDAPSLQKLNEKGEYHRANLTDMNTSYALATFGQVVALTRKVIINDDVQAFTRVPAVLGVAANRLESDTVWAIITANAAMTLDSIALFHTTHKNRYTGAGSALGLAGLAQGRSGLRLQQAPQGTPLNLIPRYILLPTTLENTGLQFTAPINLAASAATSVVPAWVQSLVPIIEPRLDANSATAWYFVADPATIDTLEYCYLEGQEGVYLETRQGFDVDGIEMKARMDFAAAPIDFRGLQKSDGV